jgi:hypothetical protein
VNDGTVPTGSRCTSTFIGSVLTRGVGARGALAESRTTGAAGHPRAGGCAARRVCSRVTIGPRERPT